MVNRGSATAAPMAVCRRGLLLAALAAATACGIGAAAAQSWDEVVRKANAEGEVLLYSTRSDADNAKVLDAFQKKYPGIKARSVRLVGGAMVTRVDQELQAGALAADVIMHAEHQWAAPKAAEKRFIIPDGPAIALWKGAEKYWQNGVVTLTSEPWVIGYNTKLVKEAPKDWDSLLGNAEFKGLIGLNEVSGLTVAVWYDFIEKKKPGYFEKLAPLAPRIYPNSAPLTAGLSSGEIVWAPYSLPSSIEPLKASGAPVDYVIPASGTWSIVRVGMIFKEAPHPNAARVLLDFMMSQEGQQVLNENRSGYTVAPGVKVVGGIEANPAQITDVSYADYKDSDTRTWRGKVDRLFRGR